MTGGQTEKGAPVRTGPAGLVMPETWEHWNYGLRDKEAESQTRAPPAPGRGSPSWLYDQAPWGFGFTLLGHGAENSLE